MATTVDSGNRAGSLPLVVKFDVTADNDVLLPVGNECVVVGAVFEGLATALNLDSGADQTATTFNVASTETLNVTTTGAGSVTLIYIPTPVDGFATQNT